MKTTFYFPTLLALTIQVMVNGQTPASQTLNSATVVKTVNPAKQKTEINSNSVYLKELIRQANYCDSVADRLSKESKKRISAEKEMMMAEVLDLREQSLIKQTEASVLSSQIDYEKFYQNSNSILLSKNNVKEDWYTVNKTRNPNQKTTQKSLAAKETTTQQKQKFTSTFPQIEDLVKQKFELISSNENSAYIDALLKQANYCDSVADRLWKEAQSRQSAEKEMMLESVTDLRNQSQQKQIDVSLFSAKIANVKFYQNSIDIDLLMNKKRDDIYTISQTKNLIAKAEQFFKQAHKMREEAAVQETNGAKLGTMLNAEEQEFLALSRQKEAIYLLKNSNLAIAFCYSPDQVK